MSEPFYRTRKDGYWGRIAFTDECVYDLLLGKMKMELPKGVVLSGIDYDMYSRCLNVFVKSDKPINNVTYEVLEGCIIPLSSVKLEFKMDKEGKVVARKAVVG